jgi:hypothetical protein
VFIYQYALYQRKPAYYFLKMGKWTKRAPQTAPRIDVAAVNRQVDALGVCRRCLNAKQPIEKIASVRRLWGRLGHLILAVKRYPK